MSDTGSVITSIRGVRLDTGEILGDLSRYDLVQARQFLELYLSLNPDVCRTQVAIAETTADGITYHFASAADPDDLNGMCDDLATLRAALDADLITADDFAN